METRGKLKRARCAEVVESWNPNHKDTIHKLNDDCLINIFMFLPIIDRVRIEGVCKRWSNVSKKSWQNVKALDDSMSIWGFNVNICYPNEKSVFEKVLKRCGSFLRHLDLSSLYNMESHILHSVGKLCPNLQYIDIRTIKLTVPAIKKLTKNCHNLKAIAIGNSTEGCSDTALSNLFLTNRQLRSLTIECNFVISGGCLSYLPVDMDTIILKCCCWGSGDRVFSALNQFRQLKRLSLCNSAYSESEVMQTLPTSLKILKIVGYNSFINIDCIVKMNDLEKLTISYKKSVNDAFLLTLSANCKKLYHLDISGCQNVTDVGVQALTSLLEIKYLNLSNLDQITGDTLTYMPKLKELHCRLCYRLKDDGLCTLLATCDLIEVLNLSGCIKITNILVECALSLVKNRTNNLVLNLDLRGTAVNSSNIHEKSLFLNYY